MLSITHIDTACVLLDIHGYRILTDPTLDRAGQKYHHGYGIFSRKTGDPSVSPASLGRIDMVLLSHHQHKDNFDHAGRRFTETVPLVISTKPAAKALKGAVGLGNWESHAVKTPLLTDLRITATPARHRPWWVPAFLAGRVIGFVIECRELVNGVIYISGDTVYYKGVRQVADRFKIDIAIFHLGSVEFPHLTGHAHYTMNGKEMLEAARVLRPDRIVPVHYSGWSHFKEDEQLLRKTIETDIGIRQKTIFLESGKPYSFT